MLDAALVGHVVDEDEDEDEFESDELSNEGLVVLWLFGLVCESTGESMTRGGDVCLVLTLGYLVVTLRILFMGGWVDC